LKIVVCVKQVPDTTEVKVDEETGTLIREGVPAVMNPFDQFALEEAVALKKTAEESGADIEVIVLSMGPPQASKVIMKSLALGADRGVLLTDRAFAGSDTWATSYILASAIRTIGQVDLVMCGLQAIDGDTAQVGPEMGQQLRFPQVTYVESVSLDGKTVTAKKQTDRGLEVLAVKLPALITLTPPTNFEPGNPPFSAIMKAKKKPQEEWGADQIEGDTDKFGLNGSPTQVKKVYAPPKRDQGEMLEGTPAEVAKALAQRLAREVGL